MTSNELPSHPLFKLRNEFLTKDESVALSYERARLVLQTYRLSASDVQFCSDKFWALMTDPICSQDIAMFTILAAHVGLTIGTLSRHLRNRPDFRPLVDKLLRLDTVGIYLLTERGHGLDSFNIETTATAVPGGFILNTPREEAAKFMPASTPAFGVPKVALVMAKLIVDGKNHGSRFFVVPICNSHEMYRGVISTRLPPRSGTCPLDFSITSFDHVQLPMTALVTSDISDLSAPKHPLEAWWDECWRIQLGTIAVPAPFIAGLKSTAFIGACYSMHRSIMGKDGKPLPIITFRTQQWPVLDAVSVGLVLDKWYPEAVRFAMDKNHDHKVRHALAVIVKATTCRHFQRVVPAVAERCGAQGTFEHNYMARIENDCKGVIIAEGDILTLCIRLFSELLLRRYSVPLPPPEESLLSRHAHSLLEENMTLLQEIGDHRSEQFNTLILPQSQNVIEAIGHALAYSSASRNKVPKPVLDIYECSVIRQDQAWYSEHGISQKMQRLREAVAVSSALPQLPSYLSDLNIETYAIAPIVSDKSWKEYVANIPSYSGNAIPETTRNSTQQPFFQAML